MDRLKLTCLRLYNMQPVEVEALTLRDLSLIVDDIERRIKESSEMVIPDEEGFAQWVQQQKSTSSAVIRG